MLLLMRLLVRIILLDIYIFRALFEILSIIRLFS